MVMKKILIALALLLTGIASGSACTGISFLAEDGGYVQARTIEWGNSYLPSEYVIVPRGQDLVSYTPTGVNGLRFRAKYGLVGLAIIQKEFVAEGLNEVGLSAGLFYFPHYGKYEEYDEAQKDRPELQDPGRYFFVCRGERSHPLLFCAYGAGTL